MPSIPSGTRALLIANAAIFGLQFLADRWLVEYFALWPYGSGELGVFGFAPWQLVTYGFLHGSVTHLIFNMFALWMFGADVERVYGRSRFLTYYVVCVVTAGLTQMLFAWLTGAMGPTVGASGGVFGLLLAFGMLFPHRVIMLIFPPIPMPAWVFVTLYGALELWMGVTSTQASVAHFAHLGGMLGGFLLIRYGRALRS